MATAPGAWKAKIIAPESIRSTNCATMERCRLVLSARSPVLHTWDRCFAPWIYALKRD